MVLSSIGSKCHSRYTCPGSILTYLGLRQYYYIDPQLYHGCLQGSTAKEATFTKGSSWRGRLHVHVKRAVHLDDITGGSRLTSQTVKKYQIQPLKVTPLKQVWSFSFHFFVAFCFTL